VDIQMAGIPVCGGANRCIQRAGRQQSPFGKAREYHSELHAGPAAASYWTCDFTAEYVRINASYRT